MTAVAPPPDHLVEAVARARVRRSRRWYFVVGLLAAAVVAVWLLSLIIGQTIYSVGDVFAVIVGQEVQGASFTVGRLRLPRASLALVSGLCFGLGGVAFQTLLRNPLASPDLIGISSGASAAAAFAIVVLGLSGPSVSAIAIAAGLGVALLIYALAYRDGVAGARLILTGIGIAAMLQAVIYWVLLQAGAWDYQYVLRWLTGSLNGANWSAVVLTAAALVVLGPVLLTQTRALSAGQLGDDAAQALGVRVERTRIIVIVCAVVLVAFATAGAGPIAFVAFLSGPIAARLIGSSGSLILPAALVGAVMVLLADFVGQNLLGTRFPVGVVTGVLGAPYLIYLIVRMNRVGGGL